MTEQKPIHSKESINMEKLVIPQEYWDENRGRFNSHAFFKTVNHHHISDYNHDETCDIMIVECQDGRWYIEDNFGNDARGHQDVFCPFNKTSYPTFFPTLEAVNLRAAQIVSSITGAEVEDLLLED